MAIWQITGEGPQELPQTKLKQEKMLEEDLEEWIEKEPLILGEPLLIIGRQVMIPEVKDRLDLLAVDPQGNAVVVELKRGKLRDPVDMQALRYASYISKWGFEDFENQARNHFGRVGDTDFNFNEIYETFCADAGVDEPPDLNVDQRIIIVGSEVKEKLGSVALWLRDHTVDIKVIEVEVFKEGENLLMQPQVIIPLPVGRFTSTGKPATGGAMQPWVVDGMAWHLEKRCSPQTREMFQRLDDTIRDNFEVDGPRWGQKHYIAYRLNNYNWLAVETRPNSLVLLVLVAPGTFKKSEIARTLQIEEFDEEGSIADKMGLPSSVNIRKRTEFTERVILRLKEDFDVQTPIPRISRRFSP
jgi:hypothetical protein